MPIPIRIRSFGIVLIVICLLTLLLGWDHFAYWQDDKMRAIVGRVLTDMRSMETALEAYHADHARYPADLAGLTAPTPYLNHLPSDPFAADVNTSFAYRTGGDAVWVVLSPGPDHDFDVKLGEEASEQLLAEQHRYDATNGALSSGDIWRVRN